MVKDSYVLNSDRSYFFWTDEPYSKFCGLYFNINGDMVKCLEKIDFKEALSKSKFYENCIENNRGSVKEEFYFENDVLQYNLSNVKLIEILFDVHKINDFSEWGRHYYVYEENDVIIVEYQKEAEYIYFIAIKSNGSHEIINEFLKKEYEYDLRRNSDHVRYVNKTLSLHASEIAISMSNSKKDAIKKVKNIKEVKKILIKDKVKNSLNKLISSEGIAAGYPWFYQIWARDEMISLGYLIREKRYTEVKVIFEKYFKEDYEEKMPAILPFEGNESADGNGWMFLRFKEFIDKLEKEKLLKKYYSSHKLKKIIKHLEHIAENISSKRDGSLVYSDADETWMDTSHNDEGRTGFCIEIQALNLRMYRILHELTGNKNYKKEELELKKLVVSEFLEKDLLIDYLDKDLVPNKTIRPNIFIAHYVYPWLFSKKQWESIFDKALKSLWLKWGGLSSIDVKSELFLKEYTGEGNESYHRGDSWYFLNCMAAICLKKVNSKKYKDKIDKIKKACQDDMKEGVIGSIAEVSSAKERSSLGCLSQAWSLAMYLELDKN